ncbi:acyl-ACP--UDP-N-acetylglucosamine O-acyltransferase [Desertifilum sp. FACHB-1129]|uniref:Acyl-[acyl-carrier-protein]--UDP-N-acetylglucosamine O-acyltransferase n=1 Tax=Desertifilum tharense IPPAS B-1220 TaxID=1781255 RepID=A0A1E5QMI5_9CYAN|nr:MULTISPECIES: acyl-ACP--UDP-N-acetylglucosamine O-acyltransferase [Desertifilum]MDA0212752.1 acyl-ACP--UDP-N-acetylglucosamine O-acyltransferase [Cyanobacteria bacterium FC1]MBD2313364.1 acyl-ACP--UDP-N-acetylglucosamine O-acyltransferase [Desertifilum sp. FACHB-1129]MBD2324435.1 acyl-ACP--UDP-N-acetylglucosamine O-acyltransferase [Desertifilum sp. FACHB-866]MBD2334449.1 acyl-ACP--UDP-N-acetylglucosamine O-acyltransferase [Desertifilum sp. FACHB-868]OEJ75885.1 acyl-[acyl-carrier-protein]--U
MTTLIHPTAVIHPGAKLHPTVRVGAYAVIGEHLEIGAETTIGPHVVLDGWTKIGDRNQIFAGAAIGLEPQDLKYDGSASWVTIGNDNLIREYVTINRATGAGEVTALGNQNLLMAYAHVGHNCKIGDRAIIANSVALAGHVTIESQARISGVLGIHQFVQIGRLAMVGGMSRVDRDVPPYMLVEGNPSRVRSLNLVGLKRAGLSAAELSNLKKAYRLLYRSGLSFNQALEQLELLADNEHLQHLHRFLKLSVAPGRRGPIPGRKVKDEAL